MPSSACARAPNSPAGCADGLAPGAQSQDVLTFPRRERRRSVEACRATSSRPISRAQTGEREARERRARSVAEELTRENTPVRFEQSIHIPEDEICFIVFDAPSSRDAALAAQRARLEPIRVVEAAPSPSQ